MEVYGQIAGLLGHPRAAQMVGWIMHWAPLQRALPGGSDHRQIPYQRVVSRFGGLASGYTRGGREAHKKDLEAEGIKVREDYTIDLEKYLHKLEIKFEKVE